MNGYGSGLAAIDWALTLRKVSKVVSAAQGRGWDNPFIAMYVYNLASVLKLLKKEGVSQLYLTLEQHGAFQGACCFFRVPPVLKKVE